MIGRAASYGPSSRHTFGDIESCGVRPEVVGSWADGMAEASAHSTACGELEESARGKLESSGESYGLSAPIRG